MNEEQLHLAAAKYANDRRQEAIDYRIKKGLKSVDTDVGQHKWLAHYEGFRAGFTYALNHQEQHA
jgi:hypothetical protein